MSAKSDSFGNNGQDGLSFHPPVIQPAMLWEMLCNTLIYQKEGLECQEIKEQSSKPEGCEGMS